MSSTEREASANQDLKIAFLGTPNYSRDLLGAFIKENIPIDLVITNEPKKRARGSKLIPSPVEELARSNNIKVSYSLGDLNWARPNLCIVAGFSKLIPASLIQRFPMINVHYSLLPRWRGAAPVERAILAGDKITGVSIMAITEDLDEGPIYASKSIEIKENETKDELLKRLNDLAKEMLLEIVRNILEKKSVDALSLPTPQVGPATYANKIKKSELQIKSSFDSTYVDRLVRVGGAYLFVRLGPKVVRLRVVKGRKSDQRLGDVSSLILKDKALYLVLSNCDAYLIEELIPESRAPMSGFDFMNGLGLTRLEVVDQPFFQEQDKR